MNLQQKSEEDTVDETAQMGMAAMMAMMMVSCVGVLVLVALIPILGWPLGIAIAVIGGAGLMYAHHKLMGHGTRHA